MVKDTNDPDRVPVNVVEDAMAAMMKAVNWRIEFSPDCSGARMAPEKLERLMEATQIVERDSLAEPIDAVSAYLDQVGFGSGAEADSSHAGRQ